jgi:AbrB family looped-hinge helix DNA binding protein
MDMAITMVRVSEKGQIAIPRSIREEMGIEQGDDLVLLQEDSRILLEKAKKMSDKMKDDFRDIIKHSEKALKEVWDNEEDDIWDRYLKK